MSHLVADEIGAFCILGGGNYTFYNTYLKHTNICI